MDKTLTSFIDTFAKAIKDNTAAIFAGAGLSIPAGFINWKDLLRDIASDLDLDVDKETDLIAIAQYHYNEAGGNRHKLNQRLIEEFTHGAAVTANHRILASLPIGTYWTTNYDKLIETALGDAGKTPDTKIRQQDLPNNVPRRDAIVYKMHGDVSMPDQAILTKDDYEGYNEKRPLFTTALQGDLLSKTFLFIGFGFDDPNLEHILSRIRILLGQNQRHHYCFFKRVNRKDFASDQDFHYAEVKQTLKVKDLLRYSIHALLIDTYPFITEVLTAVHKKVQRSVIFISGAAADFSPRSEDQALTFIHSLSNTLAAKGYRLISGGGDGVGSAVINGVSDFVFSSKYRHLDHSLLLRPFPQRVTGVTPKKERYTAYRQEILGHAGIALFLFGNKSDGKGGLIHSPGMREEFDIAVSQGVIPIPIGATGYHAEELWKLVMSNISAYLPSDTKLLDLLKALGDKSLTDDRLVAHTVELITLLQSVF